MEEQLRCLAEADELLDEVLLERDKEKLEEDIEEIDENDFICKSSKEENESETNHDHAWA